MVAADATNAPEETVPALTSDEQAQQKTRRFLFRNVQSPEARAQLTIAMFGLVAAVISVIIVVIQLQQQVAATQAQTQALRSGAYASLMTQVLQVDQLLVDNPGLESAFFSAEHLERVPVTSSSQPVANVPRPDTQTGTTEAGATAAQVRAAAFAHLDLFDSFTGQCRAYFSPQDRDARAATEAWMRDQYEMSPVLQSTLKAYPEWYPHLHRVLVDKNGRLLDCIPD